MNTFLMKQGIYLVLFIVGIIAFYIFFIKPTKDLPKDTFANVTTSSVTKQSNIPKSGKVLKYFGGSYCPHSREGSRAYELIKDFESEYTDVKVEYYWTGEDNDEEFQNADAQYIPTVTNRLYNKVELSVNPNDNTDDKSDIELKHLVMGNIYRQL